MGGVLIKGCSSSASAAGYNHSGTLGQVNVLNIIMGVTNAQRALYCIRIVVEFIPQHEYVDLGMVNEALVSTIGKDPLTSSYLEAHNTIPSITGYGAVNGSFISIHEGFDGVAVVFLPGSDRIVLAPHKYFAFD
ncbi:hypothetical protein B0H11DRAFT_2289446 [Mycena galericulata]|nr:hypothetical protein B0H11DRAFT_2289446 [Mycena galericulata]